MQKIIDLYNAVASLCFAKGAYPYKGSDLYTRKAGAPVPMAQKESLKQFLEGKRK